VKKSFRLRLILIFLACMVAVFLLNRFFSQQIASMYVHDRGHGEGFAAMHAFTC
jgi:hypothetical protein